MTFRILVAAVALGLAGAFAQTPAGEIAGRMSDVQRSPLPGVRIKITNGGQSREAVTDSEGRFAAGSLASGTYRVVAELVGFKTASGEITLSSSTPRAFLSWSLEAGCLVEIQRVILSAREAAPLVEVIVHIRVATAAGPVLMSVRPDCEGSVFQEYSVQVLGSAPGRGERTPGPMQMFMEPRAVHLAPGQEYLALIWRDGFANQELVLPIVSGRVTATGAGELNGLRPSEALSILAKWSQERQR